MKITATYSNTLIPQEERTAYVGPFHLLDFVVSFLTTRGLEKSRNIPAPIGSFCVIIWCVIVTNIMGDVALREEVRSTLLNTPLHDCVSFVDSFFPVTGRTNSAGNFPLRIQATDEALEDVRVTINSGQFIDAVRRVADWLNLANIARSTANSDILDNYNHTAVTSVFIDEDATLPGEVSKDCKFLSVKFTLTSDNRDYALILPTEEYDTFELDKKGNRIADPSAESGFKTTKAKKLVDFSGVVFYTQSTDKSSFSASKPVLTSFASFLIVPTSYASEVQSLLGLKTGYTFTINERTNAMYQLINVSYGPSPRVKDPIPLNPVRPIPQLPKADGINFQEIQPPADKSKNEGQDLMPKPELPQRQQQSGGGRRDRGRGRRDFRQFAIPRGKEHLSTPNQGEAEVSKITNTVLTILKALKLIN